METYLQKCVALSVKFTNLVLEALFEIQFHYQFCLEKMFV